MNQQDYKSEYEEINLTSYIKVLRKRKRLILGVFLIALIAAVVYSFFISPKIYKIDTLIEMGRIGGVSISIKDIGLIEGEAGPIEEAGQVVAKIESDVYGVSVREKLELSEAAYPGVKAENPEDTNLVIVEIESSKPGIAKNILEEIDSLILADHQEKTGVKKELLKQDVERLKDKILSLEEERKNLEAKVEALQKILPYQQTPGTQFALFDTKEKLEKKKQETEGLYIQVNYLQRALEDIQPTRTVKNPTISENPIKPRPVLNMVIAAVLGIFLGVFLAFGKEWWEKSKNNF